MGGKGLSPLPWERVGPLLNDKAAYSSALVSLRWLRTPLAHDVTSPCKLSYKKGGKTLASRSYTTGQVAAMSGVTVRALRYYHRVGLLRPSVVTGAGHRRYTDADMLALQQVLALKFLGFSLEQIREALAVGPLRLHDALRAQQALLREKRLRLDAVIQAVDDAQTALAQGQRMDWERIMYIAKVMHVQQDKDSKANWQQYYTPEAAARLEERAKTYTPEQAQADAKKWQDLIADLNAAVARGEQPAGPVAQTLAQRWLDLINTFTMGDKAITQGLASAYRDGAFPMPYTSQVHDFVQQAVAIRQKV